MECRANADQPEIQMRQWIVLFLFAAPAVAAADAFPTTEVVKFVVSCMAENGGQTDENLYTCACRFDSVSSKFTFDEYDSAVTYERYRDMPGKQGSLFRDSEEGDSLKARLRKAREEAAVQCPRVIRVERPAPAAKE
jgi:hypothetical protein